MNIELSEEESAALIKELAEITDNDRYPFSRRIQAPSPAIVSKCGTSGCSDVSSWITISALINRLLASLRASPVWWCF
jgi:hypothetical protein